MRSNPHTGRPAEAPAYYLGRPASWWITVGATRHRTTPRPGGWAENLASQERK